MVRPNSGGVSLLTCVLALAAILSITLDLSQRDARLGAQLLPSPAATGFLEASAQIGVDADQARRLYSNPSRFGNERPAPQVKLALLSTRNISNKASPSLNPERFQVISWPQKLTIS